MTALARFSGRLGRFVTIYSVGLAANLVIGLITTVVIINHLVPAQYGQLGLYLLVPSWVVVLANVGLLQATNQAVHRHAAATVSDSDSASEQATETVRRALGTGLLISLISGGILAALVCVFAPELSAAFGGAQNGVALVRIGAISGGIAGGWRLSSNILRYARRPVAWGIVHVSRVFFALVAVVVLLNWNASIGSVIVAFGIGTVASLVLALFVSRGDIRIAWDGAIAREIATSAKGWVVIVLAYQVILSTGIYFVSLQGDKTEVGLYSLAVSIAVAAHYAVSAFIYSWGPMSRSVLRVAVIRQTGEAAANASMFEGYMVVAATVVLILGLFAPELVKIAPHSYAGAAALVPVVALVPIGRGLFALTYSLSPRHDRRLFQVMAGVAMALYLVAAPLLGSALGAYGVALAGTLSFALTATIQFIVTQRSETPLPVAKRRLIIPPLLTAGIIVAATRLHPGVGPEQIAAQFGVLLAYALALVVLDIVPLRLYMRQFAARRADRLPAGRRLRGRVRALEPTDAALLRGLVRDRVPVETVAAEREESDTAVRARLIALLETLANLGGEPEADWRASRYLLFRGPYGERDRLAQRLVAQGTDPLTLDRLEQLVGRLRRLRGRAWSVDPRVAAAVPVTVPERALATAGTGAPSGELEYEPAYDLADDDDGH